MKKTSRLLKTDAGIEVYHAIYPQSVNSLIQISLAGMVDGSYALYIYNNVGGKAVGMFTK